MFSLFHPNSGMNPTITDSGESALSRNVGLQQRGMQNRRQYEQAESSRNPSHNIGAPVDPMWEGLKQAIYESGADQVQTGAAAGWDATPGFYDTQAPSMNGLSDAMKMNRQTQLTNQNANYNAAMGQSARRGEDLYGASRRYSGLPGEY